MIEIPGYLDIGLIDIMKDQLVNFAGAAVFCLWARVLEKQRQNSFLVQKLVPRKKRPVSAAENEIHPQAQTARPEV